MAEATSTPGTSSGGSIGLEQHSIDYIPASERHGRAWHLFTVWFGANMQVTTVATGALAVVLGLPLPWAVVAIAAGNLLGANFMALHSVQGPKLGIPQMIQSRAQFGYVGAVVPLILVILMYIGFFASSAVLGGSALAGWWGIGTTPATIVISVVCVALTTVGYRAIHAYERVASVATGLGFLYLTVRLVTGHGVGAQWHAATFPVGTFVLMVAIAATWQITYAPYVADYSRYLPVDTPSRSTFWWTYAGSVIASVWMMCFGAIAVAVAAKAFDAGNVTFVTGLGPSGTHWLFSIVIILGIVAVNPLNLYGMFMSSTTTMTSLRSLRIDPKVRIVFVTLAATVGTVIALVGQHNFLPDFTNFILFLSYFMVPWTAINLADFYLVRRERYDIAAIFEPRGPYGRVDVGSIVAYVVGIGVEIPFMSTSFYTGPAVAALGGADISWVIGLVVATVLYLATHRRVAREARLAIRQDREAGPTRATPTP